MRLSRTRQLCLPSQLVIPLVILLVNLPVILLPLRLPAQERPGNPLGSAVVDNQGLLWIRDNEGWRQTDRGLPKRRVYPFLGERPPRITGVGEAADGSLLLATGRELYRGSPGNWKLVTRRDRFGTYAYFTAVAGDPAGGDTIALGSSFHGLFLSEDGGEHWADLTARVPQLSRGAGYYEDIIALAFAPSGNELYILAALGETLYRLDLEDAEAPAEKLALPPGVDRARDIRSDGGGALLLTGQELRKNQLTAYELLGDQWHRHGSALLPGTSGERAEADLRRRETATGRRGIYVPFLQAEGESLEKHIAFAERHGINAFVIDFKDDWGRVTFDAELPMAREVGSRRGYLNLDSLVERLDEAGIYLIGRVVVFKDRELHGYQDGRYALRNRRTGEPWGVSLPARRTESGETLPETLREHWVDQYAPEVWEYNVSLAEELSQRGVDEIQFDYIRFPSDGPVSEIDYSHRPDGMGKEEALESFLALARERLETPIGVDVFGFNGYYEMDYLGQNIALIARYVDVISPMYYPSHFASKFLGDLDYLDRARAIYRNGTGRASRITGETAIIRPYVQAFLIGSELEMDRPTYLEYLEEQIHGSRAGGGDGYLLWNYSGRYYMVE